MRRQVRHQFSRVLGQKRPCLARGASHRLTWVILASTILWTQGATSGAPLIDCNSNGIDDSIDISQGTSQDCNNNDVPDECENGSTAHTTGNMGPFTASQPAQGQLIGCVTSTTPVRIRVEARGDLGAPTELLTLRLNNTNVANLFAQNGFDCDQLSVTTINISAAQWNTLVIAGSTIQVRLVPSTFVDSVCSNPIGSSLVTVQYGNRNYDCNGNGIPDICDVEDGKSDCNSNGRLDVCEIAGGETPDCNTNSVPDACDIASGSSSDVDNNGVPDECKADCNVNGLPDAWEVAQGMVPDCNTNGVPDSCDIADATSPDCNGNGIPDTCEVASGDEPDCNRNGVPDPCDLQSGYSTDLDRNGIPDECDKDCNKNGFPDAYDISSGIEPDCDGNAVPDSCDLDGGAPDCNTNGVPDSCDIANGEQDKDSDGVPDCCEYAQGDFDLNGTVGASDLMFLLSLWGQTNIPVVDLDGNGVVSAGDLVVLMANWGKTN